MNLITFVELPLFSNRVDRYLDEEEYQEFQLYLLAYPDVGDIQPGTRGCRKVQWAGKGRGKRGGLRIIYFYKAADGKIYLMTIYAKNEEESLPLSFILRLRMEIDDD